MHSIFVLTFLVTIAFACIDGSTLRAQMLAPESSITAVKCSTCEWIIGVTRDSIPSDASREQIVIAVSTACNLVPTPLKSDCYEIITKHGATLIDYLEARFSPADICTKIGYCTMTYNGPASCPVCKIVFDYISQHIEKDFTKEQVIETLESVCNLLPDHYQTHCAALIESYGFQLIEHLFNHLDSEVICQFIKLCDVTRKVEVVVSTEEAVCSSCLWSIGYSSQMVKDLSDFNHVREILRVSCEVSPKNMAKNCEILMENIDFIAELMQKELTTYEVCSAVSKCSPIKIDRCATCQQMIESIGQLVRDYFYDSDQLSEICTSLIPRYSSICVYLLENYGTKFLDEILTFITPDYACSLMKAC
ncbi:hypothetical protein RCL1_004661 [Eukaryota sp. TZLM3-RCL]